MLITLIRRIIGQHDQSVKLPISVFYIIRVLQISSLYENPNRRHSSLKDMYIFEASDSSRSWLLLIIAKVVIKPKQFIKRGILSFANWKVHSGETLIPSEFGKMYWLNLFALQLKIHRAYFATTYSL